MRSIFLAILAALTLTGCPYEGSYNWLDQLEPSNDSESVDSTEDNTEGSNQAADMMVVDAIAINIEDASIPEPDATAEMPDATTPASEPDAEVIVTPDAEIVPDAEQPNCAEGQAFVDGICTETITFRWTPESGGYRRFRDGRPNQILPVILPPQNAEVTMDFGCNTNFNPSETHLTIEGLWQTSFEVGTVQPEGFQVTINLPPEQLNSFLHCEIDFNFFCGNRECWDDIDTNLETRDYIAYGTTFVQVGAEAEMSLNISYSRGGKGVIVWSRNTP